MNKNIYYYLSNYRLVWISLILIISFGFWIRYLGSFDENLMLYFSQDDLDHMNKSGLYPFSAENTNLLKTFFTSYRDAHPPLRNILVNLLFRFIDNVYMLRLVSFIPGVLLIPTSFLLGYSFFLNSDLNQRLYSGLVCSFLVANMETLILLSIETRPYSFMLLFEMMAVISLLFVLKRKMHSLIIPFYIFALLAIFTDYSALVPMAALNMALLFHVFMIKDFKVKILSAILGSSSLIALVAFQYAQLSKFKALNRFLDFSGEWVNINYMHKVSDIPIRLVSSFKTFFSYPGFSVPSFVKYTSNDKGYIYALIFLFFFFLLGLVYLLIKKEYLLFSLPVLVISMAIIMAYLKFAPFGAGRQNVYLLPFLLIPIFSLYAFLLRTSLKALFRALLIIALVFFPWSQGFSWSLSDSIKSVTVAKEEFLPSISKAETFLNAGQWILNKSRNQQAIILVSNLLNTRIKDYVYFTRLQMRLGSRNGYGEIGIKEKRFVDSMARSGKFKSDNVFTSFQFRRAFNRNSDRMQKLAELEPRKNKVVFVGSNSGRNDDQSFMRSFGFSRIDTILDEGDWYADVYKMIDIKNNQSKK